MQKSVFPRGPIWISASAPMLCRNDASTPLRKTELHQEKISRNQASSMTHLSRINTKDELFCSRSSSHTPIF
ncbi:hypothetical protein C8035_v004394 [Colletotrichum spinosum]|uniref:Uncharacterized protein n=1 Tax=Colletotrichum spinosum TaxID=1347390 RepID=A0A4R8PNA9_9PEZI|nr:hypothetical protein C8035_v004394 [Colletotrichum spinosum]